MELAFLASFSIYNIYTERRWKVIPYIAAGLIDDAK